MVLSFNDLREANIARLPQFKNGHGLPAHTRPDGSDWTVAEWVQALMGELGEFAQARLDYESGKSSYLVFSSEAAKELPDIAVYLDLLSLRALDGAVSLFDPATILMHLIANLGGYANLRKKRIRGDIDATRYEANARDFLSKASMFLKYLIEEHTKAGLSYTHDPHPTGVNLGEAVVNKFNEVSIRVGSTVRLGSK